MTVESTTKKVTKPGNDAATVFTFPFTIFVATYLVVMHVDALGVATLLAEGATSTTYSVTVASYPGAGSITYPAVGGTPLATGASLVLKRLLPIEQTLNLENQGGYLPENQEVAFDKGTMVDLQQQEELDRSMKLSVGSTANPELPIAVSGAYLKWNTAATALETAVFAAAVGDAADTAPVDVSLAAADSGVAATYSRSDHKHLLPTVSVAKGGTGATDAATALTNLGAQADLAVPSQAEAEAGVATTERVWTAQRVGQAVAAQETAQATQAALEAETNENTYAPPDLIRHSPGVCKAWVKFSIAAVKDSSYNVGTIDDDALGDWGVNFTTAFSDAKYCAHATVLQDGGATLLTTAHLNTQAVGSIDVFAENGGSLSETGITDIFVAAWGDQ